ELIHAGPDLAAVLQQNHGKNRSAEFDARTALPGLKAGSGHILCKYRTTVRWRGRLPKAFGQAASSRLQCGLSIVFGEWAWSLEEPLTLRSHKSAENAEVMASLAYFFPSLAISLRAKM